MTRILVGSSRSADLVTPLAQIAAALVARGDTVFFLTGAAFEAEVTQSGATFVRLPHETGAAVRGYSDPPGGLGGVLRLGRTLSALLLTTMEPEFLAVQDLVARHAIDVVIVEPFFIGGVILGLLPRDQRPAILSVGLVPLPLASSDTAPYGLGIPPAHWPLNEPRNAILNAVADRVLLAPTKRAFALRIEQLTGVRTRGPLLDRALSADAWAQTTVPQFEYPRRALPQKVRFVGPLPPPPLGAMPAWWDFADRRPIVVVTQGTYANSDPGDLIVPAIHALAGEDVFVVVTTGGPDASAVERAYGAALPANTRVERFLPYDHLLPAAALMITNGGYGSVQHALRYGVPLLVSGTTEDKPEVNARVAWTGVGVDLRAGRPAPEALRRGVRMVLTDPEYRRAAVRMGSAIAGTDAVASILDLVDELSGTSGAAPVSAAEPQR